MNNPGDLRVWWIPQVPMRAFYVPVKTIDEAILVLGTLADYDLFQYKNNVKPDYSNAGGLEMYEAAYNEWRYGQPPRYVFENLGLLLIGPVPGLEGGV